MIFCVSVTNCQDQFSDVLTSDQYSQMKPAVGPSVHIVAAGII